MNLEVGQVWATNLPGKKKLKIVSTTSSLFMMFPIELVDAGEGLSKYYASSDGFIKHVISPQGYSYKLTVLLYKEGDFKGPSFSERQENQKKIREKNNRDVIQAYGLKNKKRTP